MSVAQRPSGRGASGWSRRGRRAPDGRVLARRDYNGARPPGLRWGAGQGGGVVAGRVAAGQMRAAASKVRRRRVRPGGSAGAWPRTGDGCVRGK